MTDYIAYVRVSTAEQGRSGLGLEAQHAAINRFVKADDKILAPVYMEIESGKRADRPELTKALAHCRLTGATLLVAKMDRLARNVAFVSQLMETQVPFVACDQPYASRLTIHILAAVDEDERKRISDRTKAALAQAKANGKVLGGFKGVHVDHTLGLKARKDAAQDFGSKVRPVIEGIRAQGVASLSGVARALNEQGIRTRRGGAWSAVQVQRVMEV